MGAPPLDDIRIKSASASGAVRIEMFLEENILFKRVKGIDFGGVIAGGAGVDVGRVNILLEGRWTLGLASIDDSEENLDIKNSVFSFMIGLGVPIGGTD